MVLRASSCLAAASKAAFPRTASLFIDSARRRSTCQPLVRRSFASKPLGRAADTTKSKRRLNQSSSSIVIMASSPNAAAAAAVVDRTPPSAPSGQTVSVAADPAAGARELGRVVREAAREAIAERGRFALVLSGGSLVDALASSLESDDGEKVEGGKWHAFWADERLVPGDSPDSNYGGAKAFLEKAGIPKENVHALADPPAASPHDAAAEYESRLRALSREILPVAEEGRNENSPSSSSMPAFDLVLLGVGPDGHVASLFPGLPAVEIPASENRWVVGVENSPKPPPLRISLTLPAINAARKVLVVSFGAGKAAIVRQALCSSSSSSAKGDDGGGDGDVPLLPVQRVKGARWLIDSAAAEGLEGGE